jgi:hypothetical protein
MDACVFLDEKDVQMVVDRTRSPPVPLIRAGIAINKRFTFYDQIHTTGIDIKQAMNARAAVTLGKDMTLRDFSQVPHLLSSFVVLSLSSLPSSSSSSSSSSTSSLHLLLLWSSLISCKGCWRMRALGKGQRVEVLVVKEVSALIAQANLNSTPAAEPEPEPEPKKVRGGIYEDEEPSKPLSASRRILHESTFLEDDDEHADVPLRDVCLWLIHNQLSSELLQYGMLYQLDATYAWRKGAFTRYDGRGLEW